MENEEKKLKNKLDLQPRPLAEAGFAFVPQTWEQLYGYAKEIAQTEFVPKDMQNKPGTVLAVWQKGKEVGLGPMAALQYICVINGRPSIYGDGFWMLITSHPLCHWVKELAPDEALAKGYGECTIQRKGWPEPTTRRFTVEMAKRAELWEKKENWRKYPGLMLTWRARHLCAQAAIPEAMGGLIPAEMAYDYETTAEEIKEEPLSIPQSFQQSEDNDKSTDQTAAISPPVEVLKNSRKTFTIQERMEDLKDWIENRATREEILANQNYLTKNLAGLSPKDQLDLCRQWNLRRNELLEKKD